LEKIETDVDNVRLLKASTVKACCTEGGSMCRIVSGMWKKGYAMYSLS
jgi:hypothetical protein